MNKSKGSKINIGILGMAAIADRSILPALNIMSKKFKLFAIATQNSRSKLYEKNIENIVICSSYNELVNNKSINAVYIPLVNSLHFDWAKKSLENNLHVLCEKPLTCNSKDSNELVFLAKQNNLVLMETFQFRFHQQFLEIQKIIKNNKLGDLRSLKASFCFPPFKDSNNFRYIKSLGGGSLLDAGCYTTKVAQLILGNNLKVKASTLNLSKELGLDIWGSAYLEDKLTNATAYLSFGFDNHYQCCLEVLGQTGKLSTERIFTAPKDYSASIKIETNKGVKILNIEADNHFVNMLNYFYNLIQSNDNELKNNEYSQIISQANIIDEIKNKANL